MRYPVVNLPRPSLGIAKPDPCAGITGLLERFNCSNAALKADLDAISQPAFVQPPPPTPPVTPFKYPGEGNIPMSVSTGGVPSAPGQLPGVSPNPPPPPPGPVRPDVASVDRYIKPDEEELPPEPEPVEPMPEPPMSVATGVPTSKPPLPPPQATEVPKCYSCGGQAVLRLPSEISPDCAEIPEDQCRPSVPSIDNRAPGNFNPFAIPGGLEAGGVAAGMSLMGRRISYPVRNL
jgi:hypothetical protein